jgi:hypothetical protein
VIAKAGHSGLPAISSLPAEERHLKSSSSTSNNKEAKIKTAPYIPRLNGQVLRRK